MSRVEHLTAMLSAFEPADALEGAHKARMLELLRASERPLSREQFEPGHFTASAFIVNRARDALLLILHGKLARWLQPGGHIEDDDADAIAAVRREMCEEVGLEAAPLLQPGVFDVDVHEIPAYGTQPGHAHFDVRFVFEADEACARAGSDARAAQWVKLSELLDVVPARPSVQRWPTDESVLRAVRKLRRQAL